MIGYYWIAKSNDGSFYDESSKVFSTQNEAYYDMRDAALEKMKWNTEIEDFDDGSIAYEVIFYPDKIIHTSYSGVYTYEICIIKKLKED